MYVFLFNWYLLQKLSDCHICWDTKLGHGQPRAYKKTTVALLERTLLETPGPSTDHDKSDENFTEHYINFLISHDIPKSMTLEKIKEATKSDKVLNKVTQSLDTGKWDTNDRSYLKHHTDRNTNEHE